MTYQGIHNFIDKCRYLILRYMREERTPVQAEEQLCLEGLYANSNDNNRVMSFLIANNYIASDNDDPMKDEVDNDNFWDIIIKYFEK